MRVKLLFGKINPLQVIDILPYDGDAPGYKTKICLTDGRSWRSASEPEIVAGQLAESLSTCVYQIIERPVDRIVEKEVIQLRTVDRHFERVLPDLSIVLAWLEQNKRPYMRQDEKEALSRVMHQIASPTTTTTGEK